MYIDDDHFMRTFFLSYFEEKFIVLLCESAEQAWVTLEKKPKPNLIVLDLNLIGQSGSSFLEEIKSKNDYTKIPVIVLSSEEKSSIRIDLLKTGAEDFIIKPFNPEELEIKITKIL